MTERREVASNRGASQATLPDKVLAGLTEAILELLRQASKVQSRGAVLGWLTPLLVLFGLLVVLLSILLKTVGRLNGFPDLGFPDFLALLIVGCALTTMGVLVHIYQLATEPARLRALSELTQNTTAFPSSQPDAQPALSKAAGGN